MLGIKFDITVDRSISPDMGKHKDFFYKEGSFSWWKNKHWEIQISKFGDRADTIFSIDLDLKLNGRDHAGPKFYIEVFGYMLDIHVYDDRHWNYDENRWYFPNEEEDEDNV